MVANRNRTFLLEWMEVLWARIIMVQAAMDFASSKPERTAMITLLEKAKDGIQGKTGTKIHI